MLRVGGQNQPWTSLQNLLSAMAARHRTGSAPSQGLHCTGRAKEEDHRVQVLQTRHCLLHERSDGCQRGEGANGTSHLQFHVSLATGNAAGGVAGDARPPRQDTNRISDLRLLQLCSGGFPLEAPSRSAGVTPSSRTLRPASDRSESVSCEAESPLRNIVWHRSHALAIQAPFVQILARLDQADAGLREVLLQRWI